MVQVVAVDRAQIVKAQLLEQRPAGQHAAGILLRPTRRALDAAREALGHPRPQLPQRQKAARGHQPRQIGAHRPHRRRDRHVVVVQHHDQPRMPRAGVVHRLIRHAGTHRAVADHGDDVALVALQVARHRHPESRRDRRGGMRRAERVVLALRTAGEARQAATRAQRANPVTPPGQDFVRIRLMPDIPDHPVVRRVEHRVERDGQLHHPERGAEMAAGDRYRVDRLRAQFVSQLPQLLHREVAQIGRIANAIQQRCFHRAHIASRSEFSSAGLRHRPRAPVGACRAHRSHRGVRPPDGPAFQPVPAPVQSLAPRPWWPCRPRRPCRSSCRSPPVLPSASSRSSAIWKAAPMSRP